MSIFYSSFVWQIGVFVALIIVGFGFGRWAEYRHYADIRRRENAFRDLVVVTSKIVPPVEVSDPQTGGQPLTSTPRTALVKGNVVISVDYFKRFVAFLRMLFGGRVHTFESLIDRGRREAILRMQQEARNAGGVAVFGMRFETSSVTKGSGRGMISVEVLAYGTALIASQD
jgi:uncharacterized protein YbjQ (UPF0145 family)